MSDRGIGVRFLAEAVILFFLLVSRTALGHSVSSPVGTWSYFSSKREAEYVKNAWISNTNPSYISLAGPDIAQGHPDIPIRSDLRNMLD